MIKRRKFWNKKQTVFSELFFNNTSVSIFFCRTPLYFFPHPIFALMAFSPFYVS